MLKTKPLSQLLHQAITPSVSQAMLLTPSGSLLATDSSPISAAAKKARTHAALAANIWNSYDRVARDGNIEACLFNQTAAEAASQPPPPPTPATSDDSSEDSRSHSPPPSPLESLTLEFTDHNLHIQLVQPGILLCLIGPTHSSRQTSSNSSLHSNEAGEGGFQGPGSLPSSTAGKSQSGNQSKPGTAGTGGGASAKKTAPVGSLGLMKTQAKALTEYLRKELKDFEPSDY
ncbi:hypothetical protein BJ508DRAFT_41809 [Ascobolus immersus RN42]|uniref:Roadblock/LAMTOR2 domain-containing protein n=1 Tax=Ascobolus immersus RN42 TaxID=1160509 RepID=A0A3N4IHI6_ASCIM|nr:hypothetical protein BJ508DRAFT_41809 [Ascobolus immersus RN42]